MSSLYETNKNTFYYEPKETSDVTIVINEINNECKHTGVVYRFCVHKAILASQCSWFNGIFSVDRDVKEVVMPDSFMYRILGNKLILACSNINTIQLIFDTLYNVVDKCWWTLDTQQKRIISYSTITNPVFYIGFNTFLVNIERHYISEHLNGTNRCYNIIALVEANEYKMDKFEEYIISNLEKQISGDPKGAYNTWLNKPEFFQYVPFQYWQRFLKAACIR